MSKKIIKESIERAKLLESEQEPVGGEEELFEAHQEFEKETRMLTKLLKNQKDPVRRKKKK